MKMYVIVREDLDPGLMLAQSGHALRLFVDQHPVVDKEWYETSNNLVVLGVPNETELAKLADDLDSYGVKVSSFREPDLDNEMTAIAVEPSGYKHLSNLPLAMRDVILCRRAKAEDLAAA